MRRRLVGSERKKKRYSYQKNYSAIILLYKKFGVVSEVFRIQTILFCKLTLIDRNVYVGIRFDLLNIHFFIFKMCELYSLIYLTKK